MKNIHVLPTEKPSRLYYNKNGRITFSLCKTEKENTPLKPCYNIYITSDEEIKEDYVIAYGFVIKVMMFEEETLYFVNGTKAKREECKKIILTTDQDLIKDGVQAIDDEFIEWFVKNQSCESVETVFNNRGVTGVEKILKTFGEYKIIIPSEEAKQETLEESFSNYVNEKYHFPTQSSTPDLESAKFGAKWQQERMYNETIEFGKWLDENTQQREYYPMSAMTMEELFDQFKKK